MDLQLTGRKAIVTGATRGIGRAIAEQLVAEGCDVAICARDAARVDETVAALSAKGRKAWGRAFDVGDVAALRTFVTDAAAALGGLDIYVSNVSAFGDGQDEAAWRQSLETDVLGTVTGVQTALPLLEKSGAGAIVVIGSVALVEPSPGLPRPYPSVKAALLPFVKALAVHYAPKNIRANVISPGTIYVEDGTWAKRRAASEARYQAALARNPMGRMGTAQEVANAAVFLASPAAGFISGANLMVDGASTQRVQY